MIDRTAFLADAQKLVAKLERDLRARCDDMPDVGRAVEAEYRRAKDAGRTGQTLEEWRADAITQQAVAWVLSCVFVRFLEDNRLVDPPKLAGPGERLNRARDEHELFFRGHPHDTDREYVLAIFDELAKRPGTRDLFGGHNPIRAVPNWLSPDAAKDLILPFFQRIDAGSGLLVHDFTDPSLDSRFLGDLYQDLSEAARKKYALLQTPVFVEEFILDRTLTPAVETFGLEKVRLIDPACGSGHFLLGAFARLLDAWTRREPATPRRELVRRALDVVHGVDLNPYAVAIARFRLLLAAWQACGVASLANAPDFRLHLACGDSLLHGSTKAVQGTLGFTTLGHHYQPEDAVELERLLRPGNYHAVVANPPYITPKDRGLNEKYRERYSTCYKLYSLAVPFMQRIFDLACEGGFTGQITANSFMKREFGKKVIEEFFPTTDLMHVIDTSGAYIPGHGTPTVILLGRNRRPFSNTIRTVMGIRGEPSTPDDPAQGQVWTTIVKQIDQPGSQSEFVSVADSPRENFHRHPWSIGGGGAAELKERLDEAGKCRLHDEASEIGFGAVTREDEVFLVGGSPARRQRIQPAYLRPLVEGEEVRDWAINDPTLAIWPYDENTLVAHASDEVRRHLWLWRAQLSIRVAYGQTQIERGNTWFEYSMFFRQRFRTPLSLVFSEVATHNHFVLDHGNKVFKQTAPVIKLPVSATQADHFTLLGLLNSSTACFYLKQVCHNKGAGGGTRVDAGHSPLGDDPSESHFAFNGTKVGLLPLPSGRPLDLARQLDALARELAEQTPSCVLARWGDSSPLAALLADAHSAYCRIRSHMIALQEDLDWQCYHLFGLIDEDLRDLAALREMSLSQRPFEIVLARKMRDEGLQTTWFARHGSTPMTQTKDPLTLRRIAAIENNPNVALIELPEYKRRWSDTPWEEKVTAALHAWLLDHLETYFDLDGRMNNAGKPTAKVENSLLSTARLADIMGRDPAFQTVAELYRGRPDFDVVKLVTGLVEAESVPLLPVLRYKPTGLDKRRAWERTWELQREEDELNRQRAAAYEVIRSAEKRISDSLRSEESQVNALKNKLEFKRLGFIKAWLSKFSLKPGEHGEKAARRLLKKRSPECEKDLQEIESLRHLAVERADAFDQLRMEMFAKDEQYQAARRWRDSIPENPDIPVPPKYKPSDFQKGDYWRLRGGLDVPKQRWVSFPHCEGADGLPLVAWAGYDHLQLAKAVAAHFVRVQEQEGGRDDPRLVPLLACLAELLPWLKQWHNEIDADYGVAMGDYYEGFVQDEARQMGRTIEDIRAWQPQVKAKPRGGRLKLR